MSDDAKNEELMGGEGEDIMALGATPEIASYVKTMWMLQIFGFGGLYLMFVEKPGMWKNPWFVSQVRTFIRSQLFFMVCAPIGMFFAFKAFSAVGKNKDPKIPFAAPNGFADSQN